MSNIIKMIVARRFVNINYSACADKLRSIDRVYRRKKLLFVIAVWAWGWSATAQDFQKNKNGERNAEMNGVWLLDSLDVRENHSEPNRADGLADDNPDDNPVTLHVPRIKTAAFANDTLYLEYRNGTRAHGRYYADADIIRVEFPTHISEYRYLKTKSGKMNLTQTVRRAKNNGFVNAEIRYVFRKSTTINNNQ